MDEAEFDHYDHIRKLMKYLDAGHFNNLSNYLRKTGEREGRDTCLFHKLLPPSPPLSFEDRMDLFTELGNKALKKNSQIFNQMDLDALTLLCNRHLKLASLFAFYAPYQTKSLHTYMRFANDPSKNVDRTLYHLISASAMQLLVGDLLDIQGLFADYSRGMKFDALKEFVVPGANILIGARNVHSDHDANLGLLDLILRSSYKYDTEDPQGWNFQGWKKLFQAVEGEVLYPALKSGNSTSMQEFVDEQGDGPLSRMVRATVEIMDVLSRGNKDRDSAHVLFRDTLLSRVRELNAGVGDPGWIPGIHPLDVMGTRLLELLDQKPSAPTLTCLGYVRTCLLRYAKDDKNPISNLPFVEAMFAPYQLRRILGLLREDHVLCADALDQQNYDIPSAAGAAQRSQDLDFCLPVAEVVGQAIDSQSGNYGASTFVRRRFDVESVRMKQALLIYKEDQSFQPEALLDLVAEGWTGLFVVNPVIEHREAGVGRHLVRTHHFAICGGGDGGTHAHISDLRLVTDHVKNSQGNLDSFIRTYRHRNYYRAAIGHLIEQLLVTVFVLNYDWGIFHNDLHWKNILVRWVPTNDDLVYRLSDGRTYTITKPTGHMPPPKGYVGPPLVGSYQIVLIDYGRMFQYRQGQISSARSIWAGGDRLDGATISGQEIGKHSASRWNYYLADRKCLASGQVSDLTQTVLTALESPLYVPLICLPPAFSDRDVDNHPERKALEFSDDEKTAMASDVEDKYLKFQSANVSRLGEYFLSKFQEDSVATFFAPVDVDMKVATNDNYSTHSSPQSSSGAPSKRPRKEEEKEREKYSDCRQCGRRRDKRDRY